MKRLVLKRDQFLAWRKNSPVVIDRDTKSYLRDFDPSAGLTISETEELVTMRTYLEHILFKVHGPVVLRMTNNRMLKSVRESPFDKKTSTGEPALPSLLVQTQFGLITWKDPQECYCDEYAWTDMKTGEPVERPEEPTHHLTCVFNGIKSPKA
jgi:hypothetical protein